MNRPPGKFPPMLPPRPTRTQVDEELLSFIREQRAQDIVGAFQRLEETVLRHGDLFMRHDAEDKERHNELRGEIRGISLRVGVLERQSERHEDRLEDSTRIILQDAVEKRKEAEEKVSFLRRNAFAIIASIVAVASNLWHLLH